MNVRGQLFPAQLELSSLDGTTGFVLNGAQQDDQSGWSVSIAGDVNGDGMSDFLIGAPVADPGGRAQAGKTYVVFGKEDLGAGGTIELSSLDGTTGFTLNGDQLEDRSGVSVSSAGDVNGDGVSDFLIGAWEATPGGRESAGKTYVVFGKAGLGVSGTVELSRLDGTAGFILNGATAGDVSGWSVSRAGDVNGDGVSDLLIGAYTADPADRGRAGKTYVVFGKVGLGVSGTVELSSLDGTTGFTLNGDQEGDYSGYSVSSAGDVNGDGVDDLLIGAYFADPTGRVDAGKTYVVFGKVGLGAGGVVELSSLDGTAGFILNGATAYDNSGYSVSSAGDVNGDGVDDLLIGARFADPSGRESAGKTYVVFGKAGLGASGTMELSSLDGTTGFTLNGDQEGDYSGCSVSSAGDVNGDGVDDLLIGAYFADPSGRVDAGRTYVVFGKVGLGASGTVELSSLDGTTGFTLNGTAAYDYSGYSVSSAGDVNGDRVSDFLIGAFWADPAGHRDAGKTYVVFGRRPTALGLPLGIAGGICAVVSSVAAAVFVLKCRHKQPPEGDQELASQDPPSEYAAIDSLGLPNQEPVYEELHLHPKGHTHYTPIDEVNRRHDEYQSVRVEASGYAAWPQNQPASGIEGKGDARQQL